MSSENCIFNNLNKYSAKRMKYRNSKRKKKTYPDLKKLKFILQ